MEFNRSLKAIFSLVLVTLLFASFADAKCSGVSARSNDWNEFSDDGIMFVYMDKQITNRYYEWENQERYPLYNYRNGYSYRNTQDYYYNSYARETMRDRVVYTQDYRFERDQENYYQEKPSYYYTFNDYMDKYEKHECYNSPPKGKIIYVKCP